MERKTHCDGRRTQKRGGRTQTAGKIQVFHAGFYPAGCHKEPKTAAGAAIGVLVLVILLVSLICAVASKVKPEDYITVSYTGADGYAVAECSVDTEKLYRRLGRKDKRCR